MSLILILNEFKCSTRLVVRSHHFIAEIAKYKHKLYSNFFPSTSHLWNSLPTTIVKHLNAMLIIIFYLLESYSIIVLSR